MLSGITLAVLLAYQYRPFVPLVVVAVVVVVAIAWGIWAILGGSRGVAYSLGVALLILGAIGTVGILDEGSDEFQSAVVSRAAVQHTHQRSGEREGSYQETPYLPRLVCPCTETGALGLEVSASLYRRNPRSVLLEYTSESLLGLWGDRLGVTSVDGEDARSSQPIDLKRGWRPLLMLAASAGLLLLLRLTDYRNRPPPPGPDDSDPVKLVG